MARAPRIPWTAELDAKLIALCASDNHSFEWIGRQIGRTSKSCSSRYCTLMRPKKPETSYAATIPCNRCGAMFKSSDRRTHRRCKSCAQAVKDQDAGIFTMGASFSGRGYVRNARGAP